MSKKQQATRTVTVTTHDKVVVLVDKVPHKMKKK